MAQHDTSSTNLAKYSRLPEQPSLMILHLLCRSSTTISPSPINTRYLTTARRGAPRETPSVDREMALQSAQPLQSRSKGPVDLEALREPSPRGSAQPLIQAVDEPHRKQTKEKAHELLRALSLSCSSSFAILRASGKREGLVTAQSMTPMIEQMIDLPRDRVCMDGLSVPVPSPICVQPDRVSGPRSRNA